METIATLYEHQAMVDGPKLPARTISVKSAQNSSLQKPQVSIRMFPQTKNQQTFHGESGVPFDSKSNSKAN